MIYFTADQHFGHKNILKHQGVTRPFDTIEEHDKFAVDQWNSVISNNDTVYHLGDFTLKGWSFFWDTVQKLNGSILVVPGGHDYKWIQEHPNPEIQIKRPANFIHSPRRISLLNTLETIEIHQGGKYPLVISLCHYAQLKWDRSHYGSLHLFGHSHGRLEYPEPRSMDIGVDTNNFLPYSLDEVVYKLTNKIAKRQ